MAIFCTKCGTKNENDAAFCDNCGEKLRAIHLTEPVVHQKTDQTTTPPAHDAKGSATAGRVKPTVTPKKAIYAGAALVAVAVLGGGAMYLVMQPPAATASTLLAAAKAGYGKTTTDAAKRELCLANTDYSKSTFNAGETDASTQAWMNALVAAGMYSSPVIIESGGTFPRNLLQYVATPELEKYREGSRLCLAKDVEIVDVIEIGKPEEQSLGRNDGPPKVLAVKAKLIFRSVATAAWMENPEVRNAVLENISGWEYKDKKLQKEQVDYFGLKENKWITGAAYKSELEKQYLAAQRNEKGRDESASSTKNKVGGLGEVLSNIFKSGHPLKGTWRSASNTTTFTSDSIEISGQSIQVDFLVEGKRIKVTPKGQAQGWIFVMEGPDTMFAPAFNERYKRIH